MKVWPVKHSPLLRQPERFIARDELKALIQKVTHNLVNIHDKTGEFLLRLDDGRVIDTKAGPDGNGRMALVCTVSGSITARPVTQACARLSTAGLLTVLLKVPLPKTSIRCHRS